MSVATLRYHTVPRERLLEQTVRGLSSCRLPARSLGRVTPEFHVTLVGCVVVNEHARSYLPAALGGSAEDVDVSADTSRLSEAAFARSPPAARLRAPAPPPAAAPGTPPRPTPPSPSRTALARAASDAVDAAEAAEGDAAGAAAASEHAILRRDAAAVELTVAQRRHTRAHPRGSLAADCRSAILLSGPWGRVPNREHGSRTGGLCSTRATED